MSDSNRAPNHPQADRRLPRGFQVGSVFRHKGGKTITEGLFTAFTEFTMTTNPLAKNARYARAYGFEGLVCPPGLVMLVAFSQTVEDVSENARANLEYIDMRFGEPVYVGDTHRGRDPGARRANVLLAGPNLGIVHVQSTARKNHGAPPGGRHHLAAQGPGLQGRPARSRSRLRDRAGHHRRASSCCRAYRPAARTTRRSPTSRAATATSRTSTPGTRDRALARARP